MAIDSYSHHFKQLDELLSRWRELWQVHALDHVELPWRGSMPGLARWIAGRSGAEIHSLSLDPERLERTLGAFTEPFEHLVNIPSCTRNGLDFGALRPSIGRLVKDRKWSQISAFTDCVAEVKSPILEWCSGKGHLGRLVAAVTDARITCIERDRILCERGRALAERWPGRLSFHEIDVLDPQVTQFLSSDVHVVALHACGRLHEHLIESATRSRCRRVSLAPCCYHSIPEPTYQPLSNQARGATLRPTRFDLKLPQQEAVTASSRDRVRRETERTWRLGFDVLQREISGNDAYLPVPSTPGWVQNKGFEAFCRWAGSIRHVEIPTNTDFGQLERLGQDRRGMVAQIEIVRHLFRRPLECWLLLDRALLFQEQGYRVSMGSFCDRTVTPRNVLIDATLPD